MVTITFYSLVFETTRMCLSSPIIRENNSVFILFLKKEVRHLKCESKANTLDETKIKTTLKYIISHVKTNGSNV